LRPSRADRVARAHRANPHATSRGPAKISAARLRQHLRRLFPGEDLVESVSLAPDTGATAGVIKAAGYGLPVRLVLADAQGHRRELVWRTASANEHGHDRRADRAAGMLQAFDDFAGTLHHVRALDVGFAARDGSLISVSDGEEAYLITEFARGSIYADDLRRIAERRSAGELDVARLDALARYLADLHAPAAGGAVAYRRAIRDLVGHGEGIFGVIDAYPDHTPSASRARLAAIEARCATWRQRLRDRHARLAHTHGDFHPFNIVFGEGTQLTLLDASRGARGDPADDLTALAVNFLLFALGRDGAWQGGLGALWHRWWRAYLALRSDAELLAVAPPFFAWRVLVVCSPRFYPDLPAAARDRLLSFAEATLDERRLEPDAAEELFR
jgi:aminoglycoside phosphotransferase (APT) family kinase protein